MKMDDLRAGDLRFEISEEFTRPEKPMSKCQIVGDVAIVMDFNSIDIACGVGVSTVGNAVVTAAVCGENLNGVSSKNKPLCHLIGAPWLPAVGPRAIKIGNHENYFHQLLSALCFDRVSIQCTRLLAMLVHSKRFTVSRAFAPSLAPASRSESRSLNLLTNVSAEE